MKSGSRNVSLRISIACRIGRTPSMLSAARPVIRASRRRASVSAAAVSCGNLPMKSANSCALVLHVRRKLPQDRAKLFLQLEYSGSEEVRERFIDVSQPLHMRDEASALDAEHEPARRRRVPRCITRRCLQRIEGTVDLDRRQFFRRIASIRRLGANRQDKIRRATADNAIPTRRFELWNSFDAYSSSFMPAAGTIAPGPKIPPSFQFLMSQKHVNLLREIFQDPVNTKLSFREVESLLKHLGAQMESVAGARMRVKLNEAEGVLHRPHHGGNTMDRHSVQSLRDLLDARRRDSGAIRGAAAPIDHRCRGERSILTIACMTTCSRLRCASIRRSPNCARPRATIRDARHADLARAGAVTGVAGQTDRRAAHDRDRRIHRLQRVGGRARFTRRRPRARLRRQRRVHAEWASRTGNARGSPTRSTWCSSRL